MVKVTYFLDVVSSWCRYVEPVWKSLIEDYGTAVAFDWEVALIPKAGLPGSAEEEDGYYRRSGVMTKQPVMLNSAWVEPELDSYLAPNLVPVACRELGVAGDVVRLAIADAAMVDGLKVGQLEVSAKVAASVCDFSVEAILEKASSVEVEALVQASTELFHSFGLNQRPAFYLESVIEDRAIFSGLIQKEPLEVTLRAMIEDVKSYRAWAAHMDA
ncbi:MAG: disulfide bond formation protein DsbA [Verrucomicrobiota bacterium]